MAVRGIRASVKKSSAKAWPPVMVVSGRASMPGRAQVDQEAGDAGVLPRRRVGAHVELAPVGEVAHGVPRLLPVDHEVVAVLDGARAQRGQVGARVGLGHALRPDLVAAQHRREEARLLLVGAEVHDRRRDVRDADHVHRAGRPRPAHLLHVDELLGDAGATPAVFDRPRRRGPAAVGQHPVPLPQHLEVALDVAAARLDHLGRQVRLQPGSQLRPERLDVRHLRTVLRRHLGSPSPGRIRLQLPNGSEDHGPATPVRTNPVKCFRPDSGYRSGPTPMPTYALWRRPDPDRAQRPTF